MSLAFAIAWLLPLAAGIALWLAIVPRRGPGWLAAAAGHGSLFGMLLAAACASLFARADTAHAWLRAVPALAVLAVLAALVAWRRSRSPLPPRHDKVENANKWIMGLLVIALASLVLRGWLTLREIWLRPTFPWDAWDAWAVKSKTWFLLGHYAPFLFVLVYVAASIVEEIAPDRFLRAMPGGEMAADPGPASGARRVRR